MPHYEKGDPYGGVHRPEITLSGITWDWNVERGGYTVRGADLPAIVTYMGPKTKHGIFDGWTLLYVGCGVGYGGYVGPDGPMTDGAEYLREQARRKLRRALDSLVEARETYRATGMRI